MQLKARLGANSTSRPSMSSGNDHLPASHIAHLLHRASQAADHRLAVATSKLETSITPRQYAMLLAVSQREESRQVDLTSETGIDRSTVTDVIRRLQRRGLIICKRSRVDARAKLVRLTPEGEELLRLVQTAYRRAEIELLELLPNELRQSFVSGLEVLIRSGRE